MKNLVLVFVVAFAFCMTAMASDIAFYIGHWLFAVQDTTRIHHEVTQT